MSQSLQDELDQARISLHRRAQESLEYQKQLNAALATLRQSQRMMPEEWEPIRDKFLRENTGVIEIKWPQDVGVLCGFVTERNGKFGSWLHQSDCSAFSFDATALGGKPAGSNVHPAYIFPTVQPLGSSPQERLAEVEHMLLEYKQHTPREMRHQIANYQQKYGLTDLPEEDQYGYVEEEEPEPVCETCKGEYTIRAPGSWETGSWREGPVIDCPDCCGEEG